LSGRLDGKVALVTGSSRGIGAAVARAFRLQGARVAVTYLEHEAAAREVAARGEHSLCLRLDVRERSSVRAALAAVTERWGRLDVLVNNAGTLAPEPFLEISEESWDATFETNARGAFLCTQEAARLFERTGSGSVVNVSSVGGQLGGPKAPHYAAAKAALLAFTKSSARLLAPRVRVNAIAPGFIRTDMYAQVLASSSEAEVLRSIPLERVGEPEDVAAAAVFLASDEAAFVTGQVLNVNGGQYMG
jgi:3-oxoacyl-[acyl-carrier protein] reductase